MDNHLFFVCPTDHLESVINERFRQQNYFCTSLGNSILLDADQMGEINGLIEANNIKEITFVLSDNNPLILDALKNQELSDLRGLNRFYDEIAQQRNFSKSLWQSSDIRTPILSYYLNMKLQELKSNLNNWLVDEIVIDAKIFNTQQNIFFDVQVELISLKLFNLN